LKDIDLQRSDLIGGLRKE